MTITPEQRARELIFALEATTYRDVITNDRQRALIAAAIREAQNAALDQALAEIGNGFWVPESTGVGSSARAVWKGMEPGEMIEAIRSLKHKEP